MLVFSIFNILLLCIVMHQINCHSVIKVWRASKNWTCISFNQIHVFRIFSVMLKHEWTLLGSMVMCSWRFCVVLLRFDCKELTKNRNIWKKKNLNFTYNLPKQIFSALGVLWNVSSSVYCQIIFTLYSEKCVFFLYITQENIYTVIIFVINIADTVIIIQIFSLRCLASTSISN